MQDDWLFQTRRARELRERDRVERWWANRTKLTRTPRLLVDAMIDLWPPRGDPGDLLRENEVEIRIRAHSDVVFKRTSLRTALDFVRHRRLPPKRSRRRQATAARPARTNTNNLRTKTQ
jgi:hypothetical protein